MSVSASACVGVDVWMYERARECVSVCLCVRVSAAPLLGAAEEETASHEIRLRSFDPARRVYEHAPNREAVEWVGVLVHLVCLLQQERPPDDTVGVERERERDSPGADDDGGPQWH